MMEGTARARERRRIGPWRLLDIVTATMPLRGGTFMAAAIVPEFGPPDAPAPTPEPVELPGSNIADGEQQAAVRREAARRFVRHTQPR
jgi:hypothetical protein